MMPMDFGIVKNHVETLIKEATQKKVLEPEMDNDYTSKIAEPCRKMADYENDYLGLQTLQGKNSFA